MPGETLFKFKIIQKGLKTGYDAAIKNNSCKVVNLQLFAISVKEVLTFYFSAGNLLFVNRLQYLAPASYRWLRK
jgi:hypothetical protein